MAAIDIAAVAAEALAAIDAGRQVQPFSKRHPDISLDDAYRVTAAMRRTRAARGDTAVGRKIGFTNRTIWDEYNVHAPIWGTMYDTTVHALPELRAPFPLAPFAEPRIEPEVVFGMAETPRTGMDDVALLGSVDWVAHGFEIVQSIFPAWKFTPADTVAANGLHGALLIGPRVPVAPDRERWLKMLSKFEIELKCNGAAADRGHARNVLDGPLHALRHLVDMLAADPHNPSLSPGEIVTTGTLTRALPIKPGETWSTALAGVALADLSVTFA